MCVKTYVEHHGRMNQPFNWWHASEATLNQACNLDLLCNIAGFDMDTRPGRLSMSDQLCQSWRDFARPREQHYVLCTLLHHPAGNASSNTTSATYDDIGSIWIHQSTDDLARNSLVKPSQYADH